MADTQEGTADNRPDPAYRVHYPWHAESWTRLTRDLARLPHALLLHGLPGLGKQAFAWRLAQSLLCARPQVDTNACGTCGSCRLFLAGTHPDLLSIGPVEDSLVIAIDQVRAVRDFVVLKPHTASRKIVIVYPAESMNINAANAMLKVLEEPPAASVLLLVTPQPARLPATIRSRCSAIAFRPPDTATAVDWLQQQGVHDPDIALKFAAGAPLRALALGGSSDLADNAALLKDIEALRSGSEEPLRCAARWKGHDLVRSLTWFQGYLADAIRIDAITGKNPRQLMDLFRYLDVVSETRALAQGPLDAGLLLEDLFIRWARIFRAVG